MVPRPDVVSPTGTDFFHMTKANQTAPPKPRDWLMRFWRCNCHQSLSLEGNAPFGVMPTASEKKRGDTRPANTEAVTEHTKMSPRKMSARLSAWMCSLFTW